MRKAAAVEANVPALSAPHKLGDHLPLRPRESEGPRHGDAAKDQASDLGIEVDDAPEISEHTEI
jgi:hypothetical protein